jgi:predicted peroxiredoxin
MNETTEKIVYMATKGPENPEMALMPFVHAVGAQTMDVQAVIFLLGNASFIAKRGFAEQVRVGDLPPLGELLNNFLEMGGRLLVCGPCIKSRAIGENELLNGAEVVGAGNLTQEVLSANAVLNY